MRACVTKGRVQRDTEGDVRDCKHPIQTAPPTPATTTTSSNSSGGGASPPSDATHTVLSSAHIYVSVQRIRREPPAVTMRSGARPPPPPPLDAALRVCLLALVCVIVAVSEGAVHRGESRRVVEIILDRDFIAIKCIFFVVLNCKRARFVRLASPYQQHCRLFVESECTDAQNKFQL